MNIYDIITMYIYIIKFFLTITCLNILIEMKFKINLFILFFCLYTIYLLINYIQLIIIEERIGNKLIIYINLIQCVAIKTAV